MDNLKHILLRNFVADHHVKVRSGFKPDEEREGGLFSLLGAFNNYPVINSTSDLTPIVTNPQWQNLLQNQNGFETEGCTGFTVSESFSAFVALTENRYIFPSPRAQNFLAGTQPDGNSVQNQVDAFNNNGFILNSDWPWTPDINTWDEYYANIPQNVLAKANKDYEIVAKIPITKAQIKEAMKYGLVVFSGYAWVFYNGYYQSWGSANHCFGGIVVNVNDNGSINIFDHYAPFIKTLAPNYVFGSINVLIFRKKQPMTFLQTLIKRGLQYVLLVAPTVINNIPYGAGVYNISANGVVNDTTKQDIYDAGVNALEAQKKLVGIDVADFTRLINNLQ